MSEESQKKRQGKYLTFTLMGESYGIPILKVREIIGRMRITPMPEHKVYFKGVINLRDKVIPVIDLRLLFGLPEQETTERTCIIIVEVTKSSYVIPAGIIVDEVSEVLNVAEGQIEDAPRIGMTVDKESFILGMAKQDGMVKILLDIDRILAEEDVELLRKAV